MTALKLVISGSYRKHLKELYELKRFLTSRGFEVLSPSGDKGSKSFRGVCYFKYGSSARSSDPSGLSFCKDATSLVPSGSE
jgi:hypothetical protein